jgi:hypothetical protein
MRLKKIEDVRAGQIWTFNDYETLDLIIEHRLVDDDLKPKETAYYKIYAWNLNEELRDKFGKGNCIDVELTDGTTIKCEDFFKKGKLIGFLNITHRIEDNKLVEIPRKEFEVDDVIQTNGYKEWNSPTVITYIDDLDKYSIFDGWHNHAFMNNKDIRKIGILGVNYEFVNERLLTNK